MLTATEMPSDEVFQFAANWWAEQIRETGFNPEKFENKKKVFADNLVSLMKEKVTLEWGLLLDTDRTANDILADAAKEAKISPGDFPWETIMFFDAKKSIIRVKDGRHAKTEQIFPVIKNDN